MRYIIFRLFCAGRFLPVTYIRTVTGSSLNGRCHMTVYNGYGGSVKINRGTFDNPQWVTICEVMDWNVNVQREQIDTSILTDDKSRGAGWNQSIPGWREWNATFNYFTDPNTIQEQGKLEDYIIADASEGIDTVQLQLWVDDETNAYMGEGRIESVSSNTSVESPVIAQAKVKGFSYLVRVINGSPISPISADFFADNLIGPAPLTTYFYNRCLGHRLTYQWDINGDTISEYTVKNPIHTYTQPGVYDVTLNASNIYGTITKTIPRYIEVLAVPEADFTSNVITGKAPLIVDFTATASCPGNPTLYYSWDVDGDGKIDYTGQTCEHIYHDAGVHNVTLIVRNRIAAKTVIKRAYIIVTAE